MSGVADRHRRYRACHRPITSRSANSGSIFNSYPFRSFYGINRLISLFPDCIVYTSAHGQEGLYSEKLNFSKYHDHPFVFSGNKVKILHEGDRIEIFRGQKLEVLETPGHDPGCLTYFTENYIFTGDSYLFDTKVSHLFLKVIKSKQNFRLKK